MTQTVLGSGKGPFVKRLNRRYGLCVLAALVALGLNLVLTALRNDQNHTALLWLNILLDVAAGWFLIFYISLGILPDRRLLRLYNGSRRAFGGTVTHITAQTKRVRHMDCYTVTLSGADTRQLFLPAGTALELKEGEQVTLWAVDGVIVEAQM